MVEVIAELGWNFMGEMTLAEEMIESAKLSGADLRASKPHPEIFIKAAKASGYDQKHCVVIEDSTNGIAAANAAGIYCIGFKSPHSKNQNYTKASKIITDFSEISYHKLQALKNK